MHANDVHAKHFLRRQLRNPTQEATIIGSPFPFLPLARGWLPRAGCFGESWRVHSLGVHQDTITIQYRILTE